MPYCIIMDFGILSFKFMSVNGLKRCAIFRSSRPGSREVYSAHPEEWDFPLVLLARQTRPPYRGGICLPLGSVVVSIAIVLVVHLDSR